MRHIQIISASAGSGKTYRLAEFLEQVVKEGSVRPDAILATTFTIKAAAELQERVRTRLLSAGLATEAQQLSASRIGTVNSVCGGLLTDFAFELGISPDQQVIDEDTVPVVLRRAMARVIDANKSRKLLLLEQCFPGTDCRKIVEEIIAKARANGLGSDELVQCGTRSAGEFMKLLGTPADKTVDLYTPLKQCMNDFLAKVGTDNDTTKATRKAVADVQRLRGQVYHHGKIPWCEWLRLMKLEVGKKSRDVVAPLLRAAASHDTHPQLHKDCEELIHLVFQTAAQTLAEYEEYKRQWGVVDFTDQEVLTLRLLEMEEPSRILQGRLDLVLVDEFQDTSPIQLAIFFKLAALAKKSVWVGDQKQAIYGFRDADPVLMDAAIAAILQDKEPETLQYSWRSRPELVRSSSDIFASAFARHGFPEQRVRLEPSPPVEKQIPKGLGPAYECWYLASKNKENDALALANTVSQFLADTANSIRDPKTGLARRVKGGDIAILCRENIVCEAVANGLAQQGIKAAMPRSGLLACPEIVFTLAVVRLLIDPRDSLARAEIARLLDAPDDHDSWLSKAMAQEYAQGFDLQIFTEVEAVRDGLLLAGPLDILDTAMEISNVRQYCLSWENSEERLANLDSLRHLSATYVEKCGVEGKGASAAGLLTHLLSLQSDEKAVVRDEETVQVLTWHKAKGLEWPVTVLFQLEKQFPSLPLGVNVVSDNDFDFESPLADRWLRFWPNPYNKYKKDALFHERLVDHPATVLAAEKEKRQELRLLYVGWTRARDKVILAGRPGFLQKGILSLLVDEDGEHLLQEPREGRAVWAGSDIAAVERYGSPAGPVEHRSRPGTGYKAAGEKEYPQGFLAASAIDETGTVGAAEHLGERIPLTGKPDMQLLGEAIHTFLAADNLKHESSKRLAMAQNILQRWRVSGTITTESLIEISGRLHQFVSKNWPDTICHREYPVALRKRNGTIISGSIDLLLKTPQGYVVIDHKSFPGGMKEAEVKAAGFAGQLGMYAEAIENASGEEVLGCFVHLPLSGLLYKVTA